MLHHLYGILERPPQASRLPATGVGDGPLLLRRIGGLVILFTPLDALPRRTPYALTRHREVQTAATTPGPFFPLPYGVTVTEVEPWLAPRAAAIRAGLRLVRGRVEMRVSVLALHLGDVDPRRITVVADRIAEASGLTTWRSRTTGGGANTAISLAFLVRRAEVATFLARIAPVATHAGDVAVVPSGPWPASTFVPPVESPVFPALPVPAIPHAV
ncbi:MAG: GvpL/GvpF family gas vesicle protein [Candidatus Rokubacteria bacterium]|nr:GvpL/GvpF family gas vesicle protein [Candidatus Rokubacteria bacterium]